MLLDAQNKAFQIRAVRMVDLPMLFGDGFFRLSPAHGDILWSDMLRPGPQQKALDDGDAEATGETREPAPERLIGLSAISSECQDVRLASGLMLRIPQGGTLRSEEVLRDTWFTLVRDGLITVTP